MFALSAILVGINVMGLFRAAMQTLHIMAALVATPQIEISLFSWIESWFVAPEKNTCISAPAQENIPTAAEPRPGIRGKIYDPTVASDDNLPPDHHALWKRLADDDHNQLTDVETDLNLRQAEWTRRVLLEHVTYKNADAAPPETIALFYDFRRRAFAFYSRATHVPVDILDQLAAKYVTLFSCKSFYLSPVVTAATEPTEEDTDPEKESNDPPVAAASAPTPKNTTTTTKTGDIPLRPWMPGGGAAVKISGAMMPKSVTMMASSAMARAGKTAIEKPRTAFFRAGSLADFHVSRLNGSAGEQARAAARALARARAPVDIDWRTFRSSLQKNNNTALEKEENYHDLFQ